MAVTKVRTSGRIHHNGPSSALPKFKTGQLVRGTVQKILGEGMIQARIRGHTLIASTSSVTVSAGEDLLLRVLQTQPRPHLQVMNSLSSSLEYSGNMAQLVKTLLDLRIPVTYEMLNALTKDGSARTVLHLLQRFQENPRFWRRFLWASSLEKTSQIQSVISWLDSGAEIFSQEFLSGLTGEMTDLGLFQSFPDFIRGLKKIPRQLQLLSDKGVLSPQVVEILTLHWGQWHSIQELLRHNARWFGTFFPFWWQNENGIAALSFWRSEVTTQDKEPARLSILMACRNGWVMQFLLDYRVTDLAGAIEVNQPDLARLIQDLLPGFHRRLQEQGYTQIGVRVNVVEDLEVDYAQLFPPDNAPQTYAG